ncbi:tetratricopeptide repeat protein [Nonomuraea zeae]|uniref:Tetratricopeptide repeat protein n=1 Tax=Nonomuraea zeae TaxID=1642303 RepID=A0A5S4GQI2_9ACTN|nr:tetratricopeptide repeat protein [Nonomuraea zeae]TMR28660.1 tetratricopeptide repeat protein [Nonomuraea zeae]
MNTRRRVRLGGYGAAVLMVAVAVTSNQVLSEDSWSWSWLGAALTAAVATVLWDRWRAHVDPDGSLVLTDEKGRPPRLADADPFVLGVGISQFAAEGLPPHVPRDIDEPLAAALTGIRERSAGHRLVIVQGERLAGATHSLVYAARRHLPAWRVAMFADDHRVRLPGLLAQAAKWTDSEAGVVLWWDSMSVTRLNEFTPAVLDGLPPGTAVLATVHTEEVTDTGGSAAIRQATHVPALLRDRSRHLTVGTVTPREREWIRDEPAYESLRAAVDDESSDILMGRLMAALDAIRQSLTPGTGEHAADRISLLRVVTDWYRVQMPGRLTDKVLLRLWREYRRELSGLPDGAPVPADGFTRALDWASGAPSTAHPRLITFDGVYRPHPLLSVIANEPAPVGWSAGGPLWDYAEQHLKARQIVSLGHAAFDHGDFAAAVRLLRKFPLRMVAIRVRHRLGHHLYDTGDVEEARRWWLHAADTGDPDAAPHALFDLGVIEHRRHGDMEKAQHWWKRAAETDHPHAAPKAMISLGLSEHEFGRVEEARAWYLRVIGSEHSDEIPEAMRNLAALEQQEGRAEEARHWYVRVVESGPSREAALAMFNLGDLESEQGRPEEARAWYLNAIDTDDDAVAPRAMVHLGLLTESTDLTQSKAWWERAAGTGHDVAAPTAMNNLGRACRKEQQLGEARRWYTRLLEFEDYAGRPHAMLALGEIDRETGRTAEARRWYTAVIQAEHDDATPKAMLHFALLELGQGRPDAAMQWLELAMETDHADVAPLAMLQTGYLEQRHGRFAQARDWYARTIESAHPRAAAGAAQAIQTMDRRERDLSRAEWYVQYGYLAYADFGDRAAKPDASVADAPEDSPEPDRKPGE